MNTLPHYSSYTGLLIRVRSRISQSRVSRLLVRNRAERMLLSASGLCVVDGVFVSGVLAGLVGSALGAISFGFNIFTGAACFAAAAALEGSVREQVLSVVRVYLIVAVGALIATAMAPVLSAVLLPNFRLISGLVLIGLAKEIWCGRPQAVPRDPAGLIAAVPAALAWRLVLAVGFALSLVGVIPALQSGSLHITWTTVRLETFMNVLIAVTLAATATAAVAAVGGAFRNHLELSIIRKGGALALIAIASYILGLPIPAYTALLVFAAAVIVSVRELRELFRRGGR